MDITGKIIGITYKALLTNELRVIDFNKFNINNAPASCIVQDGKNRIAISKWVSPKRTRTYPYERVYNTLNVLKNITVIPIIKDEGFEGDRDFIQWDTVSLMSLIDVFVIFACYNKAVKNPAYKNKITDFQFDNKHVISKIKEIEQYHSSALHWNLNELKTNLHSIIDKAKKYYKAISKQTGVQLHGYSGIDNFRMKIGKDVETFMQFSREKAKKAQTREMLTTQPKESLSTLTKAKITITNYLGGQYFFTVDEIELALQTSSQLKKSIKENTLYLIESKHSKNSVLPSKCDIKDGLLKMILYSNLCEVMINGKETKSETVLNLTSSKLIGNVTSKSQAVEREKFINDNKFLPDKQSLMTELFREANENGFTIKIGFAK